MPLSRRRGGDLQTPRRTDTHTSGMTFGRFLSSARSGPRGARCGLAPAGFSAWYHEALLDPERLDAMTRTLVLLILLYASVCHAQTDGVTAPPVGIRMEWGGSYEELPADLERIFPKSVPPFEPDRIESVHDQIVTASISQLKQHISNTPIELDHDDYLEQKNKSFKTKEMFGVFATVELARRQLHEGEFDQAIETLWRTPFRKATALYVAILLDYEGRRSEAKRAIKEWSYWVPVYRQPTKHNLYHYERDGKQRLLFLSRLDRTPRNAFYSLVRKHTPETSTDNRAVSLTTLVYWNARDYVPDTTNHTDRRNRFNQIYPFALEKHHGFFLDYFFPEQKVVDALGVKIRFRAFD